MAGRMPDRTSRFQENLTVGTEITLVGISGNVASFNTAVAVKLLSAKFIRLL